MILKIRKTKYNRINGLQNFSVNLAVSISITYAIIINKKKNELNLCELEDIKKQSKVYFE